jgi:hypothetical protein
MKKTIIASMVLATFTAGVLLYSCEKQETIQSQNSPDKLTGSVTETKGIQSANQFNVSVVNNRLVFATIADYRKVVDNQTDVSRQSFLSYIDKLQFNSLQKQNPTRNDVATTKINNDYFRSILNPDMAVQIGDNIFRVNASEGKVYVLPSANADQYGRLVAQDMVNSNITAYSTGDEVLDLIEHHGSVKGEQTMLFCSETGIGGRHTNQDLSPHHGTTAYADFDRYGIYFSLYATIDGITSAPTPYNFEFSGGIGSGYIYYHQRCGRDASYEFITRGSFLSTTKYQYNSYQGSKDLNKVYFYYRVMNVITGLYETPLVGFRVNY